MKLSKQNSADKSGLFRKLIYSANSTVVMSVLLFAAIGGCCFLYRNFAQNPDPTVVNGEDYFGMSRGDL